jgi:hypothetical protein
MNLNNNKLDSKNTANITDLGKLVPSIFSMNRKFNMLSENVLLWNSILKLKTSEDLFIREVKFNF